MVDFALKPVEHRFAGSADCAAMVRLHGVDYALVKRYVDAGAQGIICPLINTAEQAQRLVEAVKYPPLGNRGVGFCRANGYGQRVQQHFSSANDEIILAVQIEHADAVRNIDAILAVPGIDAVFIGPYDLTASMGIAGQFDNAAYLQAKSTILEACRRHGVVPGIHVVKTDPTELIRMAEEGYGFLAYSLDITMILNSCQTALAQFKSLAAL
eukprot:TRINITY_DN2093_c0_g1_i1.p1 TRINITY_DN2093_c0_g1~~TRINITY_DN2093_c0_g1_i1.p1  ORF type:complete len:212 (-),score=52.43 TRINITY_DN2093_c0_g1_i1:173-808(-)